MARHFGSEVKTTPKANRAPTLADLAWAAGFLEGEGYFGCSKARKQIHATAYARASQRIYKIYYNHAAVATQVNEEPLHQLQAIFGGTIKIRKPPRFTNHPQYVWSVYGGRARGVMITLYLFMSGRRKAQIHKALAEGRT